MCGRWSIKATIRIFTSSRPRKDIALLFIGGKHAYDFILSGASSKFLRGFLIQTMTGCNRRLFPKAQELFLACLLKIFPAVFLSKFNTQLL